MTDTSGRWRLPAALIAVLAVGVLAATWVIPSYRSVHGVEAVPRSMHCEKDVPFRLFADEFGTEAPYAAFDVTLRPTSFCQLEVSFVNHGPRSVHLDTATFATMAPGDERRDPLELTQNGGTFTAKDSGATPDGDAVISLDTTLAPGETSTLLVDLRTRKSGFLGAPGRTIGILSLPKVHLSSAGIRGSIDGSVRLQIREKK